MVLSDKGIKLALKQRHLEIDPLPIEDQYTTSAVDLHIGPASTFRIWDPSRFKPRGVRVDLNLAEQEYGQTSNGYMVSSPINPDGTITLPPNSSTTGPGLLLCQTRERVFLAPKGKLAARVEGRSSLARIGLMVHLTAPTIHSGFDSTITLEMVNHGPFFLRLVPNETRICQLIIERLETKAARKINTKFQGQKDPSGRK